MPQERGRDRSMTASATRDLTIIACAVSAGMHGALTPEHFRQGVGAGGGFLATVLLAVLAFWLTIRPRSGAAPTATALVFGGCCSATCWR
jgi:hypothetical protein